MLKWTAAGAVSTPSTLQVRVTRRFPGRVAAGAPEPERNLSDAEVRANLEHFTVHRRGPRTTPCTRLVLSGVDLDQHSGLGAVLDVARTWGIEHVTLHLGHGHRERLVRSPLGRGVDAVALRVAEEADLPDVAALAAGGPFVTALLLLDTEGLQRLDALAAGLARARPGRVVLTWPFPPSDPPPPAARVAAALPAALATLDAAGLPAGVKGLPACALGEVPPERLWRSANRWYVDAAHQRDAALLFFPDVVRFARTEACRFCAWAGRCDGAPEPWLQAGLAGRLHPLD